MLKTKQISKALRLISSDAHRYSPRKQLFRLQFLDVQGNCQPLEEFKSLKLCEHCVEPQTDFYQKEFEAGRLVVPSAVGITYLEEEPTVQDRICHCSHCYLIIQTPVHFSKEVLLSWSEGLSDWEFHHALIFSANSYELFQILRNEYAALEYPHELNQLALRVIRSVRPNLLSRFFKEFFLEIFFVPFLKSVFVPFLKKGTKKRNGPNQGLPCNPSALARSITSHMSWTVELIIVRFGNWSNGIVPFGISLGKFD